MPRLVFICIMIYCFITYYLIASDKTGVTTASFSTPSSSNLLIIVTINIPHFSCNIEKSNDATDSSCINTSVGKTIKS